MAVKSDRYEFIWKAIQVHGYKYDYSKVEYLNNNTKVCIICPIHGEFWQTPVAHIYQKQGCGKCGGVAKLTTKEFIEKAKLIHGDKYNYSKVVYKGNKEKICIICSQHGEFYQRPNDHLMKHGCVKCGEKYNKSELKLFDFLHFNFNDNLIYQYKNKFLFGSFMSLDFYLPKFKIAIEYQGEQHFLKRSKFSKNGNYEKTIGRDLRKFNICKENDIKLFYFSYEKNKIPETYLDKIYTDEDELLDKIKMEIIN